MEKLADLGASFQCEKVVEFIEEYRWLPEFRIDEYFTKDYWQNTATLPPAWRTFADSLPDDDFESVLISLASTPSGDNNVVVTEFSKKCYEFSFFYHAPTKGSEPSQKRKKVSSKKTYEIEVLSELLADVLREQNLKHGVDIGAGQGYLSFELLAAVPDLTVTGIECSEVQVHGSMLRSQADTRPGTNRFTIRKIKLDANMEPSNFDEMLAHPPNEPYLAYSLHACGSLSEAMLALFVRSSSATALFNIACCYNLIDETLPGEHFPMSARVRAGPITRLTRNMKMVACQAPYRWAYRPDQTKSFFRRHYYRALLETFLADRPQERIPRLGTIPDSALVSFETYCAKAWEKLDWPQAERPNAEACQRMAYETRQDAKRLAFLWTMRALIGMPIEALILYDRYAFLQEACPHKTKIKLCAVFDPVASPRNLALFAYKNFGG